MDYFSTIDHTRKSQGLLTISEVVKLHENNNLVYDPFSTLISKNVDLGCGNIFYPGVYIFCSPNSTLKIANKNIFYSNTQIESIYGSINVGSSNIFGDGGFTAKTNTEGSEIVIGDNGRYKSGAAIYGRSQLETGSQVLGPINVESCTLQSGGCFNEKDVASRAGLLKGYGSARKLCIPKGHVIQGNGIFHEIDMKPQLHYHTGHVK